MTDKKSLRSLQDEFKKFLGSKKFKNTIKLFFFNYNNEFLLLINTVKSKFTKIKLNNSAI